MGDTRPDTEHGDTATSVATGVFPFDHDHGDAEDLAGLLGGKGAGLASMTALGLPVPPGFTIGLPVFRVWRHGGWPSSLDTVLAEQVAALGERLGRTFGDPEDPLLLSVRSGAPVSMPGMLDTVLDLGLNDETVRGLAAATGDARFAWDSHARFVRMYGTIVLGAPAESLPPRAAEPGPDEVRALHAAVERATGRVVPEDPAEQLREAVRAVFASWDGTRARTYRQREGLPEDTGTAVNVQAMVFGNRGTTSGTGVVFTRDPSTGAPVPTGDYLVGGQGEDVVDGSAHPVPFAALADVDPAAHAALTDALHTLERHHGHVCDVEFTVEQGRLWLLQTRAAKLSAVASVRSTVDLVDDPSVALPVEAALAAVPVATRDRARADLAAATRASRPAAGRPGAGPTGPLTTGVGASPGRATGAAVFSSEAALEAEGDVVLVRPETSPADVVGMSASVAILTSRGGLASHAAVVARGWGVPAVVGAAELVVGPDGADGPGGVRIRPGDVVTVDGASGAVWLGVPEDAAPSSDGDLPSGDDDHVAATAALERLERWAAERQG